MASSHAKSASSGRIVPAIPLALSSRSRTKPAVAAAATAAVHQQTAKPKVSVDRGERTPPTTPSGEAENAVVGAVANGVNTPISTTSDAHDTPNAGQTPNVLDISTAPEPPAERSQSPEALAEARAAPAVTLPNTAQESVDLAAAQEVQPNSATDDTLSATSAKPVRELPPPFYPSRPQSNPSSIASTPHRKEGAPQSSMHQSRLSATSLVFGGNRESNNSSPAVPATAARPPPPPAQPQSTGPQMPHFIPPPFTPGGHAYHFSEPHINQLYAPQVMPQSAPYGPGKDNPAFMGSAYSNQPRHHYNPNGRFRPPGLRQDDFYHGPRFMPQMNPYYPQPQNGRHPEPSMIRPPYVDSRRMFEPDGTALDQQRKVDASRRQSIASPNEDISAYLRHQFGNADFADYVLELSHAAHLFAPISLPAHGILLARSPKLRSLIAMQHGNNVGFPRPLGLLLSDKFLNREDAFVAGLRRLYGEPLLEQELEPKAAADAMRLALAYAATGHFLEVDEIITHGLDTATRLLSWETIEMALAFALDGGLSFSWNSPETADDKGSSSSVEDAKMDSPASAPTYGIYSERLLSSTVAFLIHNVPSSFAFAANTRNGGRSRLSQIRFGDMSIESHADTPTDPVMTTISEVLVSLPFPVLKHILESPALAERLGRSTLVDAMRAVVEEREGRRRTVQRIPANSVAHVSFDDRLLRNARWVEKLEPAEQAPAGLILTRHRTNMDTPPSSDSTRS